MQGWWETVDVTTELGLVLRAIARGLSGRLPTPDLLKEIASHYRDALPGHQVIIEHKPKPPKGTKSRGKASYTIFIKGSRVNAGWGFSPGELADLLKRSLSQIEECRK
jgi:hypothetical protein